jgi:hypothetical protein
MRAWIDLGRCRALCETIFVFLASTQWSSRPPQETGSSEQSTAVISNVTLFFSASILISFHRGEQFSNCPFFHFCLQKVAQHLPPCITPNPVPKSDYFSNALGLLRNLDRQCGNKDFSFLDS